jgi:hypothetical protein
MSVQILEGEKHACLFCNTTDWAFGPVFANAEQAMRFLATLPKDARRFSDAELANRCSEFMKGEEDEPQKEMQHMSNSPLGR